MRASSVLLVVLLWIGSACTGGSDPTATATATSEPPTASPTVEVTPSATSEPPATPTAAPTSEPTAVPAGDSVLGVVKVHRNDEDGGLNLRDAAAGSAVLTVIPHQATGLVATGQTSTVEGTTWTEVTYEETTGWVDSTFLTPLPSFEDVSCGDPSSDYSFSPGAVSAVPAPEDAAADHVFAIHHLVGSACERTVVTFGRDFSFDADFDLLLQPSDGVPAGIGLAMELGAIRVALPPSVTAAASTATESFRRDNGGADLLFVRPGSANRFGILGLWDRNRGVRYFFLENPGRLVIDTVDAPTGSGIALGALVSEDRFAHTVLRGPINVDTDGAAPIPPIEVTGYARPFEATTSLRLRTVPPEGAPPGSGDPVIADWTGSDFAAACGSQYAVMTTDWLEAWGVFNFAITGLAPGTYELFVGEESAEDGRELGVYHVFTVGGSTSASC